MTNSQSSVRRRDFLKGMAVIGATVCAPTLVSSRALGLDGEVSPSNRLNMGAIGIGGRGSEDLRHFLERKAQKRTDDGGTADAQGSQ